jgi:hypothetical protein
VHILSEELWDADRVVNYNHDTAHVHDQRGIKITAGVATSATEYGLTTVQPGKPWIPNNLVSCEVFRENIAKATAKLREDAPAGSGALQYRLIPGANSIYREDGGAVQVGGEVVIYEKSRLTPTGSVFDTPSRTLEMHLRDTAISTFANPLDVQRKVLGHEAGHAIGLVHFGTSTGPCDGFGETILSIPMCAGSVYGAGYWTDFVGSVDARAGHFGVVE